MNALIQYGDAIEAARSQDWEGLKHALNSISTETLKEIENDLSGIQLSETLKKKIIDGLKEVENILKKSLETKTYLPELDQILNKIYDIYLSEEPLKNEDEIEEEKPSTTMELPEDIDESLVGVDFEKYPDLLFEKKSMNKKAQKIEEELEENLKKLEETINELKSEIEND